MPPSLEVVNAPLPHIIRSELNTNIAGHSLRRKHNIMDIETPERQQPPSKKKKPKLKTEEEGLIVKNVERYIDHGFPMKREAQILEIALLTLKEFAERNDEEVPKTVSGNWVPRFLQRHPELERKFLDSRDQHRTSSHSSFRPDPDTVLGFLDVIDQVREKYPFSNENVYTVGELGFISCIRSESRAWTIARPEGVVRSDRETRDFRSVIHCLTYGGKFLNPFIITKGHQKVSKRHLKGSHVATNHRKGWADEVHFRDWVKSIFNPSTKENVALDNETPWRLLLVDGHHFDSYTEMEMLCFSLKIICISFPRKSARFISPLYSTALDAVGKSWAEGFRRRFRNGKETYLQLSMKEFVISIQRELFSHHRQIENHGAWLNCCLLPPNRRGLHRLLLGTQQPETPHRNTNQDRNALVSPVRTNTPSHLDRSLPTPDIELSSTQDSPEYSPPPNLPPIDEEFVISSPVYVTGEARAKTPEPLDECSKRKFQDDLNSFEDSQSPRSKRRHRDEVITGFMSYYAQTQSLKHTLNQMIRSPATTPISPNR